MPIRPVGRPRKGSIQLYKEAEMECKRNAPYPASRTNIFDLEHDDLTQIRVQTERSDSQSFNVSIPPTEKTEQVSFPKVIAKGLINTKGMLSYLLYQILQCRK